ncbi:hypothetical protein [Aeoliella mucimassa]|uniref:PEP-CTERM protein-sorting domain-containing protein n=1 Tax=Aeoliella mucimassa TaxID=2527972 RepID=A0A518AWS2_9BACT|nr:hypothetical protein [Aeoliella mucimassa]QDU59151.1 hypothetical protein Pan181_53920 [Aeoliella mucimassa]
MMKHIGTMLLAVGLVFGSATTARAEMVILRTGNGTIGSTDSLVTMLEGPADSGFVAAFTAADFASAQSGPSAVVVDNHPEWIDALSGDPVAQWVSTSDSGTSEGSSALYAIDFELTELFSDATINLLYAVDNVLGDGVNQGVFLNGVAVSGDSSGGNFSAEYNLVRSDIAPLLNVGTNTLYINATDQGGPSGLIFSATITTTPIPEPTTTTLCVAGAFGLLCCTCRHRRVSLD